MEPLHETFFGGKPAEITEGHLRITSNKLRFLTPFLVAFFIAGSFFYMAHEESSSGLEIIKKLPFILEEVRSSGVITSQDLSIFGGIILLAIILWLYQLLFGVKALEINEYQIKYAKGFSTLDNPTEIIPVQELQNVELKLKGKGSTKTLKIYLNLQNQRRILIRLKGEIFGSSTLDKTKNWIEKNL